MKTMEDDVNFDVAADCDYNSLKNQIANVLRRYFETDDRGRDNERYDENYTAAAALDDIHEIIGEI